MRIAQIAPLWESVPPKTYGGTEQIVHLLSEELVERGYDVTLFATGDSRTQGDLVSVIDKPFRELGYTSTAYANLASIYESTMLSKIFAWADQFDIIHNHLGYQALPFARLVKTPVVTTLHGGFTPRPIKDIHEDHRRLPYISISDYQRKPCPNLNYVRTIYHGLPLERFQPCFKKEKNYLAHLGRMCEEKGTHLAIEIARQTGWNLIMAGKVDYADQEYFDRIIRPQIDGKQIQFIGELNHDQKVDFLRNAAATLCPVLWPEPFGLVLIESLACGTPIFALRDGSIPEIVGHGETGFIGETHEDLIRLLPKLNSINRRACRRDVEKRFSVGRMTDDYLAVYEQLVRRNQPYPQTFRQYATALG